METTVTLRFGPYIPGGKRSRMGKPVKLITAELEVETNFAGLSEFDFLPSVVRSYTLKARAAHPIMLPERFQCLLTSEDDGTKKTFRFWMAGLEGVAVDGTVSIRFVPDHSFKPTARRGSVGTIHFKTKAGE